MLGASSVKTEEGCRVDTTGSGSCKYCKESHLGSIKVSNRQTSRTLLNSPGTLCAMKLVWKTKTTFQAFKTPPEFLLRGKKPEMGQKCLYVSSSNAISQRNSVTTAPHNISLLSAPPRV
jgi:hypothetical protein